MGHVMSHRSTWGHEGGHLEVTEVIWDMSGHRGQLGVIRELNWRSSGTCQVTEISLESSERSLDVTEVIWDTSSHRGQLGVITELN